MERRIKIAELPLKAKEIKTGDTVYLSGTVYTARDAAHKKLKECIDAGKELPFALKGAVIYYAGPTPTKPGAVCGSFGPTTSGRMDPYTPELLDLGLAAMIGKGERNEAVRQAIIRNKALYFCAIGGAGAIAAKSIRSLEVIAFPELGCESIKKLEIEDFPLICAIDTEGKDIFFREETK